MVKQKRSPKDQAAVEHEELKAKKYSLYRGTNDRKRYYRFLLMERLRAFSRIVFPVGTVRHEIYARLVAGLRLLFAEGPLALVRKLVHVLKRALSKRVVHEYPFWLPTTNLADGQDTSLLVDQMWEKRTPLLSLFPSAEAPLVELPQEIRDHALRVLQDRPVSISVVIATWNRADTVCNAVRSALGQSYPPHQVIVSDDGSDDNSLEILRGTFPQEIASGRLVLLDGGVHRGVSHARNKALEAAHGEVVAYLDSDNEWQADYLLMTAAVYSENDEIHTAYAGLYFVNMDAYSEKILFEPYDRRLLLTENFIDLNVFSHRRSVVRRQGYFDVALTRLVDWELIIRYTRYCPPARIPYVGAVYRLDKAGLGNITHTQPLDANLNRVQMKHVSERLELGLLPLRLGYVLWDFPSLSQTFVMNELRWLVKNGYDVNVYYHSAPDHKYPLDFSVNAYQVVDADHLSDLLLRHGRNHCHSHFVYPAVTLLAFPACAQAGIPFTFMPHAVDLFHKDNFHRNRVGEISRHELCRKVFVYGGHHREFLLERGVPVHKIAYAFQAVDVSGMDVAAVDAAWDKEQYTGIVIARFIEKKGIQYLLQAAKLLEDMPVRFDIYGFGPLLESYKSTMRELGLKNVTIHAELNGREQLDRAYEQADFLMVPSVVAENGDMDGFPTVILEAMARGLPVIATGVSAVPDYLMDSINAIVVDPADPHQLEQAVRRLVGMPAQERAAMLSRAKDLVRTRIGVGRTMQALLDVWLHRTVDIILVTYNTQAYDSKAETLEIVRRVLERTASPYNLMIVDNGSDAGFFDELQSVVDGLDHVSVLRKTRNMYLGPATNTALRLGRSRYAIYLCSKEGFIRSHGWEQALLRAVRRDESVAMAGHLSFLPRFVYGRELVHHPDFGKFRSREFALEDPSRIFKHVQGGVFILDREKALLEGGFNDRIPQANMDVEFSYFLESRGCRLVDVPSVVSITTKTRPQIGSLIDEHTVVAHPLTMETVDAQLDAFGRDGKLRCNICGWAGAEYAAGDGASAVCPACRSTHVGRLVFRSLASSHHIYRGGRAALLCADSSLEDEMRRMFSAVDRHIDAVEFAGCLENLDGALDYMVVDMSLLTDRFEDEIGRLAADALKKDGVLLLLDDFSGDVRRIVRMDAGDGAGELWGYLGGHRVGVEIDDYQSYCLGFGSNRLWKCTKL